MKRALRKAAPGSGQEAKEDEREVLNSTTIASGTGGDVRVCLPVEPPSLSREASRVLLAILIELTEVPVLVGPAERETE